MSETKITPAEIIKDGSIQCDNCNSWRTVRKEGTVEECLVCGDDEWDVYEVFEWRR